MYQIKLESLGSCFITKVTFVASILLKKCKNAKINSMNINALEELTKKSTDNLNNDDAVAAIRQFAKDNELVSHSVANYKYAPAWLGMVGYGIGRSAHHIVSGEYNGYQLWMFLMRDNALVGVGLDQLIGEDGANQLNEALVQAGEYTKQPPTTGIVRIRLPKVFPQLLLDSSKNDIIANGIKTSNIQTEYTSDQRLSLEGDFNEYFDLYAPVGLQVNALTLLAPNMMQILKKHAGLIDVEFYGNEMILITHGSIYSPDTMKALNAAIDEQLKYLTRLLPSWNYSPNTEPFDRLRKSFVTGSAIKFGKYRITPTMQFGAAVTFFVLVFLFITISKAVFGG